MRSSLVATFAAACLLLGAPSASATPRGTVGGPLLATDGIAISPLTGAQALHLQAYDTFARTPSGLDAPGESTSAYDLALVARAGLAIPEFRHYVSIVRSRVPAPHHKHFQIYTHNRLLTTFPGDIGIKN